MVHPHIRPVRALQGQAQLVRVTARTRDIQVQSGPGVSPQCGLQALSLMESPRDMHRYAGDERLPAQVELPDGVLESVMETAEECSIAALQPDQEVRIGQVVPLTE